MIMVDLQTLIVEVEEEDLLIMDEHYFDVYFHCYVLCC